MGFLLNTKNEGGVLLAVFVLFSYRIPRVAILSLVFLVGKRRLGSPDYLNKNGVSEVIAKLDALPCLYLANAPAPPCTPAPVLLPLCIIGASDNGRQK